MMMKFMLFITALVMIAAVVLMVAVVYLNFITPPTTGTVIDKHYSPMQLISTVVCVGNPVICHPQTMIIPDSYYIETENGLEEVRRSTYKECAVGDYFDGKICTP